jgi:Cytochrome c554 and c-prime
MDLSFRTWRRTLTSFALVFSILSACRLASAQSPILGESPLWVGTGSCAATACHGGRREPLSLKGSEYAFSQTYDPHVRAYSVLFDDRSKVIEKNLKRLTSIDLARPQENDTCLQCHVHQGYDSKAVWTRSPGFAVADGVSCEGCHGPAGKWLTSHMEIGWKGLSDQQKLDEYGMRPTKDLLARSRACTECHVGLGPMDVNHDLIAAGHPRLSFEFGNQLAKLPKHWRLDDDKARNPDYEAKVFVLGQLQTAKASLDLLQFRASRSLPEDSTVPWPEFAEYSCFSCHHELVKDGWAAANATLSPKRGTLQWGTWSLPMVGVLSSDLKGLDAAESISSLGSIRTLMTMPDPDAATIAERARQASLELDQMAQMVNRGQVAPGEVRAMLARSLKPEPTGQPLDWDRAARKYLAILALDKAAADSDPRYSDRQVVEVFEKLYKGLNLPMQVDRRGGTFDSPYRFDPVKIQDDFRSVQAALPYP